MSPCPRLRAALLVGALASVSAIAGAYELPAALHGAREDLRSVATGTDEDAKRRLMAAWQAAESVEEQARRKAVIRTALALALQRMDKAGDRLFEWALAHRADLLGLVAEPEKVAGARSTADKVRRGFFTAADEWNSLLGRSGRKIEGAAREEYRHATGELLRRISAVADAGGRVTGRFLLKGFDRVAGVDSSTELHRQAKALTVAHDGGDGGAADRVKALGWGRLGAPAEVTEEIAALEAYRASLARFQAELSGVATPAAGSAQAPPPAGAQAAAAPAPAPAATAAVGSGAIAARLDQEAATLLTAPSGGGGPGRAGLVPVVRGLSDPTAVARTSAGWSVRRQSGGLKLPTGFYDALAARLRDEPDPPNQTTAAYDRYVQANTPVARRALEEALKSRRLKPAIAAYIAITGEPAERVTERIQALMADRQSGDKVAKVFAKVPTAAELLKQVPAGRLNVPADQVYLSEVGPLPKLRGRDVILPAVAAYLAPPAARDGDPRGDEQATAAQAVAFEAIGRSLAARAAPISAGLGQEREAIERANTEAGESHVDAVRDAAFGPMPASCSEGQELCPCPEQHIPATHEDRCHQSGTACDGQSPISMEFK